jgi:hypothetical protein
MRPNARATPNTTSCRHLRDELRAFSAAMRCTVLHGNRDFLLGAGFCAASGATTLIEDPTLLRWRPALAAQPRRCLCLDDTDYLAFRAQVRSPPGSRPSWRGHWPSARPWRADLRAPERGAQAATGHDGMGRRRPCGAAPGCATRPGATPWCTATPTGRPSTTWATACGGWC